MTAPSSSRETIHATCIAMGGVGVLLYGASGSGKSDLALRLIDRGATLVSDDYTELSAEHGRLIATAPANIAGLIEIRGLGIVTVDHVDTIPVGLCLRLDSPVERMPPEGFKRVSFAGVTIPALPLAALEASAPIKVEFAVRMAAQHNMESR